MDKQSTQNVRADMQRRRMEIAVALSTLGRFVKLLLSTVTLLQTDSVVKRSFDLKLALATEAIKDKVDKGNCTADAILDSSNDVHQAIMRLETISLSISDDIGSMKSLLSAASSSGNLENDRSPSPVAVWAKGWKCDQWDFLGDLLTPLEELSDSTFVRRCAFCGAVFRESPAVDMREHHLETTHNLAGCVNQSALYLDVDLFTEHLKTTHNATLGNWTETLLRACSVQHAQVQGPMFSDVPKAGVHDEDSVSNTQVELWEDDPPQSTGEALVAGLWDSNLLGEWISGRDRINRWMLHMLGAEAKNAHVLQSIYQEQYNGSSEISSRLMSRLVLKYWFIDEAALGVDLSVAAANLTRGGEMDHSSLHLSARPSGTKSNPSVHAPRVRYVMPRRGKAVSRAGSRASSMGSINERLHEAQTTKKGRIGVCSLDTKARSKPMRNILNRLAGIDQDFDIIIFGDKVILEETIELWPRCDYLIIIDSDGFPLQKAISYKELRNPLCVNDPQMQMALRDRRLVLRILDSLGIPILKRLEVNRDGGPTLNPDLAKYISDQFGSRISYSIAGQDAYDSIPVDIQVENDGDTLVVDGKSLRKPFTEQRVDTEDHTNIIYYSKSQGGGGRQVARKQKFKSSSRENSLTIPRCINERDASFLYERYLGVENDGAIEEAQTITVHTAGPECFYAAVYDHYKFGKKIWRLTDMTNEERQIATKITVAFDQDICEIELYRFEGISYVTKVNGWGVAKDNNDYYDEVASFLRTSLTRGRPQGSS